MSDAESTEAAPAAGHRFDFDRVAFVRAFADRVSPLVIEEWDLDEEAVAQTEGDPDQLVALVVAKTDSSKALARKHLTEIAEVAGVKARGLEARLVGLISRLEKATAPVQERVARTQEAFHERAARTGEALQDRATRTGEALRELSEQGQHVIEEVRQAVPQAEEKVKENLWTALLAALGVGLLLGLVVGLSRGR
ncbi:MAG: ElaB/YqjD/DUF883 family membrane-anchored ribosome-binding protein [Myxococcota bacterium]|jgi:ElaB/YqjD/DUF883 family membrane-anchored ribosome-binding protein